MEAQKCREENTRPEKRRLSLELGLAFILGPGWNKDFKEESSHTLQHASN